MDKEKLLQLYNKDLNELLAISSEYTTNNVEFCSLVNARNGKCSQDCKYCAQSSHYLTDIKNYPLITKEEVKKAAVEAKGKGTIRFAVVTSGKSPDEEDFGKILELIGVLNKTRGIRSCASLGILNEEQVKELAKCHLKRYHHNINTSRSYYKEICSTHSYEERINTCKLIKKYSMELCSGVIIGMGESVEQRIEMALELSEIQPDSIPVNILMPIPKTPFENYYDKIDEDNIIRTLAVLKIANPKSVVRLCGGRMRLSEQNQELTLRKCVEGIMTGDYLTTTGKSPEQDIEMVRKLNKNIVKLGNKLRS